MRNLALILATLLAATVALPAFASDVAVEAPILKFVADFNKGDVAGAQSTMAEKVAIIDEIAPFNWHGKDAFASWGKDYEIDAKAKGITDPSVILGTPTRELVSGGHAYVIAPATYRFAQRGVKMAEVAQMTFSLEKGAAGWKISGWTWTGPDATSMK